MSLAGRVLAGRYLLDHHLADGGMGAVWVARELATGARIAVKLMRVEGVVRADLRARFEQEAVAVRQLQSPHVVRVLDLGTDGGTPFIAMELLEGVDLLELRERGELWPLTEIAELLRQVSLGLGEAHRAGILHRDVKPANIFLAQVEPGEPVLAKVIDFGIAKWAENKEILTAANVALGSPSYMSPEQVRGLPLDGRVDAWALAVVAFSLVTGDLPFVGRTGPEIARQVVFGTRRTLAPTFPEAPALERFFDRAFARDISARHASVEDLAYEFGLAVGAPTPLVTATRAVAAARETHPAKSPLSPTDDALTSPLVREEPEPLRDVTEPTMRIAEATDPLGRTVIDDRVDAVSAYEDAAARTRRSD